MIISNSNNDMIYLTEQESYKLNNIYTNNFGIYLNDIINFCEYNDNNNPTDIIKQIPNTTPVVINEEDVILEPNIVNLFENYVIKPISPYNKIYQECVDYTNELLNEKAEDSITIDDYLSRKKHPVSRSKTHILYNYNSKNKDKIDIFTKIGLEKFLYPYQTSDAGIEAQLKQMELERKIKMEPENSEKYYRMYKRYDRFQDALATKDFNRIDNIKRLAIGGAAVTGLSAAAIYKLAKKQKSPKSFIGKKIASFRKIYRNLIVQAQKNPKKAGMFKRVAAKILKVIDQLMAKLQNMAG